MAGAARRKRPKTDPIDAFDAALTRLDSALDRAKRRSRELRAGEPPPRNARAWDPLPPWRPLLRRIEEIRGAERSDDFGLDARFEELLAPPFVFLYRRWWRVEASGLGHVPADGPAIVVANHAGAMFPYDAAMLKVALRLDHPVAGRKLRLLVEDHGLRVPFLESLWARLGAVRDRPENAERLLARGEMVGIFPEGTGATKKPFRDRYRLGRFARRAVELSLRTAAPIVPAGIVGAEEIHPLIDTWSLPGKPFGLPYVPITPTFPWLGLLGLVPLPSKWRIRFGAPMVLCHRRCADDAADVALVERRTEQLRETVQALVDGERRARGSAFL
jgi:1-acyl-sn-glycerol-3-phosphate acyltransferase